MHVTHTKTKICPCGTGKKYHMCCGLFISEKEAPTTPEELMRSRYTAYTEANIHYICLTMKSPAADNFDFKSAEAWAQKANWTGLKVIKTSHDAHQGIVEFSAYYTLDDKNYELHEVSKFLNENGKWYYVDHLQPENKIGRNDKCPCGSDKKYKKCCGR